MNPFGKKVNKAMDAVREHIKVLDAMDRYSGELNFPDGITSDGGELLNRVYCKARADGVEKEEATKMAFHAVSKAGYRCVNVTPVLSSLKEMLQKAAEKVKENDQPPAPSVKKRFSILDKPEEDVIQDSEDQNADD